MIYIKKKKIIRKQDSQYLDYGPYKIYDLDGHGKPQTRRDFFGRVAGASLSFALMPSLFDVLQGRLFAQECPTVNILGDDSIPIVIIDYAGGIQMAENFIPLAEDGSYLNNYGQFAVKNFDPTGTATDAYSVDTRLGYPMFGSPGNSNSLAAAPVYAPSGDSKTGAGGFIEGFFFDLEVDPSNPANYLHSPGGAPSGYSIDLNQVDSVVIAGESNSDSNTNLLGSGPGMARLGVQGALSTFFGERAPSGGRHETIFEGTVPNLVQNQSDIRAQARLGGISAAPGMSVDKAKDVLDKLEKNLSGSQLAAFKNKSPQEQVDMALKCGILTAKDLAGAFTEDQLVDETEAELVAAFSTTQASVSADSRVDSANSLLAGLVQLATRGYAKVVVEQKGGHDRHRGQADVRPYEAQYLMGELTRAIIQYAQSIGSPIAVLHTTDGAMSSRTDEDFVRPNGIVHGIHPGDNDQRAMQALFVSSPKIDRSTNSHVNSQMMVAGQPKRHLGSYTDSGLNTNDAFFSNSVTDQAKLHVALYAQMNGLTNKLESVIGSTSQFEAFHYFNNIKKET